MGGMSSWWDVEWLVVISKALCGFGYIRLGLSFIGSELKLKKKIESWNILLIARIFRLEPAWWTVGERSTLSHGPPGSGCQVHDVPRRIVTGWKLFLNEDEQ